ncbi:MAG: 4-hydroxy-tetrahydrodipicolinate synthase [Actinomycetota bacterium]|nr:4-hydroxy-tetrahydrodipicolinate synthase [Actinomycetota bacterium]
MAGRFGAIVTAMVTPFRDDLSLDPDRAAELAGWLLDHGSDSLVVAGTTGEGPTLSDDEKSRLWRAVVEAVDGRGRVIAGTGTNDTAHSIHLTHLAEEAGADAALVVSPYYNKPSQEGLIHHFTRVAESTELPVVLYNIPGRTAVRIEEPTLLALAGDVDNIVAVKDSTGDAEGVGSLVAHAPSGFEVYSGDDWATFPYACLGAVGVVSVSSHVVGDRMRQMLDLVWTGDVAAARKVHQELIPVYRGMFLTSSPAPVKTALALLGQPVGPPRSPIVPATEEQAAAVKKALEDAGAL